MFWDRIAKFYDLFERIYNGKVYKSLGNEVAKAIAATDFVLECACGTGAISKPVAERCQKLIATDYSNKMLKKAKKKCKKLNNVEFAWADITHLNYEDGSFDKVVAGNVIHLLDDPYSALKELERVCRVGGQLIIPSYINMEKKGKTNFFVRTIDKAGAKFKQQFTYKTYQEFFEKAGYKDIRFEIVDGKMPCAIAFITKNDINKFNLTGNG